jgi:hypothetical protein
VGYHFTVLAQCNDLLEPRRLIEQAEFEQALATESTPASGVMEILATPGLDVTDKVWIVALYRIIVGGRKSGELAQMMGDAGMDASWAPVIENLVSLLGQPYERSAEGVLVRKNPDDLGPPMKTDRWCSLVYRLIENIQEPGLDAKKWNIPPHEGRWRNTVLYVMGGVSFMDLRWLNHIRTMMSFEEEEDQETLFVGASNTLTPKQFLSQLTDLSSETGHPFSIAIGSPRMLNSQTVARGQCECRDYSLQSLCTTDSII